MVDKSECPPLRRKLPECVLAMVMDYHGRAPRGIHNDVYYSDAKAMIDLLLGDLESVEGVLGSWWYVDGGPHNINWDVHLNLKREAAAMASLMHKRVFTYMQIGGVWYPRCFVEAISKKRTSIKISNTVWKGKWVKLDSLQAAHLIIRNYYMRFPRVPQ